MKLEFKPLYQDYFAQDIQKVECEKVAALLESAKSSIHLDDIILYRNCADGNSYISSRYFGHGYPLKIILSDLVGGFKTVNEAVDFFLNDYIAWFERNHSTSAKEAKLKAYFELSASELGITPKDGKREQLDAA